MFFKFPPLLWAYNFCKIVLFYSQLHNVRSCSNSLKCECVYSMMTFSLPDMHAHGTVHSRSVPLYTDSITDTEHPRSEIQTSKYKM